jgi:serine/threonine protein kinase
MLPSLRLPGRPPSARGLPPRDTSHGTSRTSATSGSGAGGAAAGEEEEAEVRRAAGTDDEDESRASTVAAAGGPRRKGEARTGHGDDGDGDGDGSDNNAHNSDADEEGHEEEADGEENSHELSLTDSMLVPGRANLRGRLAVALLRRGPGREEGLERKAEGGGASGMAEAAAAVAAEAEDDEGGGDACPAFSPEELVLGKFLGRGGFSNVLEIRAIKLLDNAESDGGDGGGGGGSSPRRFLAAHCTRENGDARYAVKRVRRSGKEEEEGEGEGAHKQGDGGSGDARRRRERVGMLDLATEAQFLRGLEHPNIVKLRGVSASEPFSPGFFLVLDRLYDTLEDRLRSWKGQARGLPGGAGKFGSWAAEPRRAPPSSLLEGARQLPRLLRRRWGGGGSSEVGDAAASAARALLVARLGAAHDLAFAVEHLHDRRVVHRDIKPANVGFDVRGDVKIFDFGMARELPPPRDSDTGRPGGLYSGLSHMTGTLRYMAPEVSLGMPYNAGCDAYSLSLVVWEMLALRRPYRRCADPQSIKARVFERGHRPALPPGWPGAIRGALAAGWAEDPRSRAGVRELGGGLRSELVRLRNGDDRGLVGEDRWRRRSTYVYAPAQRQPCKGPTAAAAALSK